MAVDSKHTTIVLFGGSGDLSLRMLFPSLYYLRHDGLLPMRLRILAVDRSIPETADFRKQLRQRLHTRIVVDHFSESSCAGLLGQVQSLRLNINNRADFADLKTALKGHDTQDILYFLAIPPSLYDPVCRHLHEAGLINEHARLVLEKPIGYDLISSRLINDAVGRVFAEDAIYRIDHYLGKETVQNLLALRFANFLLEPLWNRNGIDHIQITIAETVGVEGRWAFYNDTGALRDMVQNHMLQLLCLVAMEPPGDMSADAVRDEKVKVLQALRPIQRDTIKSHTVRGQYAAGAINGQPVCGYGDEASGEHSHCETFVAIRCALDNWRWAGVPFYLRTGKRMAQRYTEVFIQFRDVPHSIYSGMTPSEIKANQLIIRLQPEEQISLLMMNKVPGLTTDGIHLHPLPLNLSDSGACEKQRQRIAYERLLLDAIGGNKTLFVRRDEVEAAWGWIDGIIANWEGAHMPPQSYAAGTFGPSSAFALTERHGHSWHE